MERLYEICTMIAEVVEGLAYGEIDFTYDRLFSVLKPGHPADLLDKILSIIGWDVFAQKMPEEEKIKEVHEQLKGFKATFKVKELKKPIDALEEYLYPSVVMEFPIYIDESGESAVEYPVPAKVLKKLKKAMQEGYMLEEAPGLKGFHAKLMKAAKNQLIEDIDLTGDDIDVDELEFSLDYPPELDEEDE